MILKTILLDSDDFMMSQIETENEVLQYEQNIIRESDQDLISNSNDINNNFHLFRFLLEVAWDNNDGISIDEKNLLEKVRIRLNISDYEYNIIEAGIGRYPKIDNDMHSVKEINKTRTTLQRLGLLNSIRDANGVDYDTIPEEIVKTLRKLRWAKSS